MAKREGEVVCVTGGSGYIGSWLVRLLLERGYTVHATVKDLKDEKETKHLEDFEGAKSRLRLFQMDLLNYDSIVTAITGTTGVFHLASPCIVDEVRDPENELLAPAIKGTINVLTAAKELGVGRVVVTSSISAIIPSPNWPADVVKNEECWSDEEYCKQKGVWYPLSKTLAEKAAWEFAKEKNLDIVVVNPGTVMGPIIPPKLNASMLMILRLLQGCTEVYEDIFMGSVHVKDVALAHILVYENRSATGRHLCVEAISHYGDFAAKVADLCPEYKVPRLPKDTQPGLLRAKDASKKLIDLGLEFIPMEQIIRDSVESLKSKGFAQARDYLLPMGITSENVAERYGVTRQEQDQSARAAAATASGKFRDEIVPVSTKIVDPKTGEEKPVTISVDDGIRPNTNLTDLAKLKPAFNKNGSTTAGNKIVATSKLFGGSILDQYNASGGLLATAGADRKVLGWVGWGGVEKNTYINKIK
ncbi:NAD(P)-binding Rossmann-fold superfamily protein [Abeliophyllum distichum]|uniref:NAD(P)-binding Rossmann-fold superfamily protein n=1 Tax=Abeliophyllum distichum TaxID=126358 RepID=A0ABD1VW53_9LAMI